MVSYCSQEQQYWISKPADCSSSASTALPSSSPFHRFWKTGNLDFIESPPTTQVPHQLKFYLISRDRTSNKSVLQYFVGYFFSLICLPVRVQKEPNNKPCVQSTKESHLNSRDHLGYVHGWKSKKTTTHDLKTSS